MRVMCRISFLAITLATVFGPTEVVAELPTNTVILWDRGGRMDYCMSVATTILNCTSCEYHYPFLLSNYLSILTSKVSAIFGKLTSSLSYLNPLKT
jgi:hypothetical protein